MVSKILPFATFYKNLIITISCMIGDVLTSAWSHMASVVFKFYGREVLFILVLSTMLLPFTGNNRSAVYPFS